MLIGAALGAVGGAIGAAGTQNVQGKNPHMKVPYTQQWNVTVEQQIRDVGFRVSYVGTRSVSLIYARNLNQLAPSTTPFSANRRPYPAYNQVIWADNGGNEFYSGLEVSASKRQGKNLTFGAGWTWARDLTDTQDSGGGGNSYSGQVIQNQFDRRVERANNGLVLRQRAFGYSDEDLRMILLPMASKGEEPIGSMGCSLLACRCVPVPPSPSMKRSATV